jgi:hypothetical protein
MGDREYLTEYFSFSFILRGEVKYLEEIKGYIMTRYVKKELVTLTRPTYDKGGLYILTENQWKEYQKLKKRDDRLIGAGFP